MKIYNKSPEQIKIKKELFLPKENQIKTYFYNFNRIIVSSMSQKMKQIIWNSNKILNNHKIKMYRAQNNIPAIKMKLPQKFILKNLKALRKDKDLNLRRKVIRLRG